jgi:hypothetical protein
MKTLTSWGRKVSTSVLPKSFREKCEALKVTHIDEGAEADLSPPLMNIASSYSFARDGGERGPGARSWHLHALDRCVRSRLPFHTNMSVVFEVVRELVKVKSPYTGEILGSEQMVSGGGSGSTHTIRWRDSMGHEISLTFESEALGFSPKEEAPPCTGP